ncbi:histidine kinase [Geomonas limicola]|uniref:histidine kinase n=1 Tax=Geomonas limicola TaxID=2740186 RepID=A0A6V8N3U4_9BACT|nr:XrtA/PEP-CTERM system histidine kinase PrsK [Geomonas limicola]GFO66537.1 histidine kinase [Geomonas limicola]
MLVSIAAIVLLLIGVVRVIQKERSRGGFILAAPLLGTALLELCDLAALSDYFDPLPWKRGSLFVEAVLPALWLLCSLSYARDNGPRTSSRIARRLAACALVLVAVPLAFPAESVFYSPDFPVEPILFLTDVGYYFYTLVMVLLVIALTQFEATLVNASPDALWRVKLDIVALGTMLAVQVFYYSNALLYRTLHMELVPLRSLLLVVGAGMMAYARLHWRGGARVKVSQRVQVKSVATFVVAGYLILLGVLGEGMRHLGPFFPRVLAYSCAFLAGVGLLLLFLSERVKRELKVILHKNFYQSKYDYRAQWLGLTQRLSAFESGEDLLKRVLGAYCDIFGVSGAALFLQQEGYFYCATSILDMTHLQETISQGNSLVAYMKQKGWVFCRTDDNPDILDENRELLVKHKLSFVIPLFEAERLTGFIALGEQVVPSEQYRYEDYDLMKTIARQASIAIQHQRLSEELTKARAMEAVGSLATFVVHDLKNLVATVSLIVENARQHLDNPEFQQDMLGSLKNTADKMQGLIARLKNLGESELYNLRPTDLLPLVQKSARMVGSSLTATSGVTVQGTPEVALADERELQKVLLNLFINGIEASQGERKVVLAEVGFEGAPYIRVTDTGCGMSQRFIRKDLFTPFHTTKKEGLGIGLYQSQQIVAAHGGRIDVTSVEGQGTTFTVWLQPPSAGTGWVTQAA